MNSFRTAHSNTAVWIGRTGANYTVWTRADATLPIDFALIGDDGSVLAKAVCKPAPTAPRTVDVDLSDGVYEAPAWSFTTLAFHG